MGVGGSRVPHLIIRPLLPTSCVQFCPNFIWPGGLGKGLELTGGEGLGKEAAITHASCRLSSVAALKSPVFLLVAPHSLLCK